MQKLYCTSVAEYVEQVGPHDAHPTYRCDDPALHLLGRGCKEHELEVYVAIADFKATGDLPEYERLLNEKFPKDKKGKKAGAAA